MPKFFIDIPLAVGQCFTIDGDDAHHLITVRRIAPGDTVRVGDARGYDGTAEVREVTPDSLGLVVLELTPPKEVGVITTYLYQAMPKGSKFETCLELSGSYGVDHVIPLNTRRTIKQIKPERATKQLARYQKILEAQAKQAGRSLIPEMSAPLSVTDAIEKASHHHYNFVAYESEDDYSLKQFATMLRIKAFESGYDVSREGKIELGFFIGPEGGFTQNEIRQFAAAGIPMVTLGPRILRSEYAAPFILAALTYEGLI